MAGEPVAGEFRYGPGMDSYKVASILYDLEDRLVIVNVEMIGVSKRAMMDKKESPIIVEAYVGEPLGTVPPGDRDEIRVVQSG